MPFSRSVRSRAYIQWLQHDPITSTDLSLAASAMLLPVAVGGNGGNAAADAIQQECEKQGVHTLVAGCPKSIDSDILVVSSGPG